ncbi:hypothetical protein E2C01_088150 [Portunus trituberculatus]|uniref:Uncharacterized protein n=1 Tax=Portunus trituberculatus TaxID=210409 RepID=A0A5B7JEL9_PORTR|nr:hypothetical protein [Portunus trituberculatus]
MNDASTCEESLCPASKTSCVAEKCTLPQVDAMPRKFSSFLVTRYPVGVEPDLSKELPGVYNARRFRQNGKPINNIVVT